MTSPLLDRLTGELGWPLLDSMEAVDAFLTRPGEHCLFIPGDPLKNLETNDAAVILPEVVTAFQGRFDCAVIADAIERDVRTRFEVWPTPSLIFLRGERYIGAIPKIQDWSVYLHQTQAILDGAAAAAE